MDFFPDKNMTMSKDFPTLFGKTAQSTGFPKPYIQSNPIQNYGGNTTSKIPSTFSVFKEKFTKTADSYKNALNDKTVFYLPELNSFINQSASPTKNSTLVNHSWQSHLIQAGKVVPLLILAGGMFYLKSKYLENGSFQGVNQITPFFDNQNIQVDIIKASVGLASSAAIKSTAATYIATQNIWTNKTGTTINDDIPSSREMTYPADDLQHSTAPQPTSPLPENVNSKIESTEAPLDSSIVSNATLKTENNTSHEVTTTSTQREDTSKSTILYKIIGTIILVARKSFTAPSLRFKIG